MLFDGYCETKIDPGAGVGGNDNEIPTDEGAADAKDDHSLGATAVEAKSCRLLREFDFECFPAVGDFLTVAGC
jgi:hypothetical protein